MKEFFISNWQYIISVCIFIVSSVVSLFSISIEKRKEKLSFAKTELLNKIQDFMIEAETMINYSAEEKKKFVFTRAKEFLVGLKISQIKDSSISDLIESCIALTKSVNAREKDKNVKN